ncbi:MAG: hypothetical protein K2I90_02955, partial [Odoribacter sp.]|nr:hypothetical protein [Odoribacter sp.]
VSNEHGSAFQRFYLTVRAYDEGIFVLSADENKKGRVSFMRPLSREEQAEGKEETFHTNIFAAINPEYELNDPVDVKKIGPDVFLLSRGDNLVYRIDGQTFELYSATNLGLESPLMCPMVLCGKDRKVLAYYVLLGNGDFVRMDYNSDETFPNSLNVTEVDKVYSKEWMVGTNLRSYHYFLNYENSSVYYCFDICNLNRPTKMNLKLTQNREELVNIVMDPNNPSFPSVVVISRSQIDPRRITQEVFMLQGSGFLSSSFKESYRATNFTLSRESEIRSNDVYRSTFYTNGNKLYRWMLDADMIGYSSYYNYELALPETPVVDLGEGKEITCFDFSADSKQVYLGVYDPSLPDLKGSVYVYDADKIDKATGELQLLKKYEGIADKPIKVFWKNNNK